VLGSRVTMTRGRPGDERTAPTLEQVARVAGVSIATASRVVTGAVPVSPARRARVEQAISLLGYVPDERARDLRRNAQKTIGLLVPTLADPLHAEIFRMLHRALHRDGFSLSVFETNGAGDTERAAIDVLVRAHARAVVVSAPAGLAPAGAQLLRRRDMRLIFYGDRPPQPAATCVCVDDHDGARLLTGHLIGLGHRRIGFLAGPLDGSTGVDRHAGYRAALEAEGIALDPRLVAGFGWTSEIGRQAADTLLASPGRPTALLAAHPLLAAGALLAIRARGLSVPADISLASFSESDHIRFVDPPITCLSGLAAGIADGIMMAVRQDHTGTIEVPLTASMRASTAEPPAAAQPGSPTNPG
jgi:LacI family transcriptional regulator